MSRQAEELLRVIISRAIEAESIPVPAIWRERIIDLCGRVVHKLITAERSIIQIAAEYGNLPKLSPEPVNVLLCKECGADRSKEPCKSSRGGIHCYMQGVAQSPRPSEAQPGEKP